MRRLPAAPPAVPPLAVNARETITMAKKIRRGMSISLYRKRRKRKRRRFKNLPSDHGSEKYYTEVLVVEVECTWNDTYWIFE